MNPVLRYILEGPLFDYFMGQQKDVCIHCYSSFKLKDVIFEYETESIKEEGAKAEGQQKDKHSEDDSQHDDTLEEVSENPEDTESNDTPRFNNDFSGNAEGSDTNNTPQPSDTIKTEEIEPKLGFSKKRYNRKKYRNFHMLCPKCRSLLSETTGEYYMHLLSIVGKQNSGKSVYTAKLLNELATYAAKLDFSLTPLNDSTSRLFSEHMYMPLFIDKKTLKKTTRQPKYQPMSFKLTSNNKRCASFIFTFVDYAGENFSDKKNLEESSQYIVNSSGIIFLLPPERIPYIANLLGSNNDEVNKKKNADKKETVPLYGIMEVADIIKNIALLYQEKHNNQNAKLKIPLAVTLTKSDLLTSETNLFFREDEKQHLEDGASHASLKSFDVSDHIKTEELLKKFLSEKAQCQDMLNSINHNYKERALFAVSALGDAPEGEELNTIDSYRIEDPFCWLIAKLGFFKFSDSKYKSCKSISQSTPRKDARKRQLFVWCLLVILTLSGIFGYKTYADYNLITKAKIAFAIREKGDKEEASRLLIDANTIFTTTWQLPLWGHSNEYLEMKKKVSDEVGKIQVARHKQLQEEVINYLEKFDFKNAENTIVLAKGLGNYNETSWEKIHTLNTHIQAIAMLWKKGDYQESVAILKQYQAQSSSNIKLVYSRILKELKRKTIDFNNLLNQAKTNFTNNELIIAKKEVDKALRIDGFNSISHALTLRNNIKEAITEYNSLRNKVLESIKSGNINEAYKFIGRIEKYRSVESTTEIKHLYKAIRKIELKSENKISKAENSTRKSKIKSQ